jgi:hypothetical protein
MQKGIESRETSIGQSITSPVHHCKRIHTNTILPRHRRAERVDNIEARSQHSKLCIFVALSSIIAALVANGRMFLTF